MTLLWSSFVNPVVGVVGPVVDLLSLEPKVGLVGGSLDGVGSVDDVATDVDAEITTDGAGLGVSGLGGTKHLAASGYSVVAFPDHGADGAGGSVVDETAEEALGGQIGVVLLEVGTAWGADLHGAKLESLVLEAGDDLTNESSLDAIGLDHDEGSLLGGSGDHSV